MPDSADDLARRCAAALWAADEASRALGMEIEAATPGAARVRMAVRRDMVNGHDMCHGGLVFALADSAFAVACNGYNRRTVAQGADVVFVEPARLGDVLVAEAVERVRRGRSGVYDVTVRVAGTGAVVAEFRGRSREIGGALVDS